jgi:hypothetical protein
MGEFADSLAKNQLNRDGRTRRFTGESGEPCCLTFARPLYNAQRTHVELSNYKEGVFCHGRTTDPRFTPSFMACRFERRSRAYSLEIRAARFFYDPRRRVSLGIRLASLASIRPGANGEIAGHGVHRSPRAADRLFAQ